MNNSTYPKSIIFLHWLLFLLVLTVYFSGGNPTHTGIIGSIHVTGGIVIFVLAIIRLLLIYIHKKNLPSPALISPLQLKLAKLMKVLLYISLLLVPFIGWLALSSLTTQYSLFTWSIPLLQSMQSYALIAPFHELLGQIFITLIGLHAAAALFHHFILKDHLLNRMTNSSSRHNNDE